MQQKNGSRVFFPLPPFLTSRESAFLFLAVMLVTTLFLPIGAKASPPPASPKDPATILIMFEEYGCPYCIRWKQEIGRIYDKTEEGKLAPLKIVDISEARRVYKLRGIVYTPTFVLMKNGKEVGRIVGYVGEDFFWGALGTLLKKAGVKVEG